ncbi:MAG: hypothetical protein PHF17_08380 [Arcobacteraceae bacterium]|nr:hypothetical protein [Arcobacteraceae bacterium]
MPNQIKIDIDSAESLIAAMSLASKNVNEAVEKLSRTDNIAELLQRIDKIKYLNFEDYTVKFQTEVEKTLRNIDFKHTTEGLFDSTKAELMKVNGQTHKIAESLSKTHDLLGAKVLDLQDVIDNYHEIDILLQKTAELSSNVSKYKKSYGIFNVGAGIVLGACLMFGYMSYFVKDENIENVKKAFIDISMEKKDGESDVLSMQLSRDFKAVANQKSKNDPITIKITRK